MEINITSLTPEQLKQVKAQLNAQRKQLSGGRDARYAIIDRMLQERDGESFRHTTTDILTALQDAKLVDATLAKDNRAEWLKKIQTRKQSLQKLANEDGTLVHAEGTLGYKPSAGGIGALNADRIIDWLMDEANLAKLTPADRKAILKAVKE